MQHFANDGFQNFANCTLYNTGHGYTHKTKQTHDGGVDGDIYAYQKGVGPVHNVVQCKKDYNSGVSEKVMLDYVNNDKFKETKMLYYYTTGKFLEYARKIGEQYDVIMVDGKKISTICVENEIGCRKINEYYEVDETCFENLRENQEE